MPNTQCTKNLDDDWQSERNSVSFFDVTYRHTHAHTHATHTHTYTHTHTHTHTHTSFVCLSFPIFQLGTINLKSLSVLLLRIALVANSQVLALIS